MPSRKTRKKKRKGRKKVIEAAVPADKVQAFITYILYFFLHENSSWNYSCEAKKFSINSYKKWSNDLKIELKMLKSELGQLEPQQVYFFHTSYLFFLVWHYSRYN
jgi:hypothetical protein